MADNPAKKKRRIKPSATTLREQAEQAKQKAEKEEKPRKVRSKLGPVGGFFTRILRPFKWLFRHIVPRYFRNSFNELRNVTWPTLKQSRQLTTAVILFAAVFGFFITILDLGLEKIFKKVFLKE